MKLLVVTFLQIALLMGNISARDKCSHNKPTDRIDCGFPGIHQETCLLKSCCFDDTNSRVANCFRPNYFDNTSFYQTGLIELNITTNEENTFQVIASLAFSNRDGDKGVTVIVKTPDFAQDTEAIEFFCLDKVFGNSELQLINIEIVPTCLEITWGLNISKTVIKTFPLESSCKTIELKNCTYTWNSPNDASIQSLLDFDSIPVPNSISDINPTLSIYNSHFESFDISYSESSSTPLLKYLCYMKPYIFHVIIVTHGFWSGSDVGWLQEIKDGILSFNDRGTIVVALNWKKGAGDCWVPALSCYSQAVANTQEVGRFLGNLVTQWKSQLLPGVKFWGIGFSLGAHVMGKAGRVSKAFYRISGLDPAGPSFETAYKEHRLSKKDAEFVDIIHTDGKWGVLSKKPDTVSKEDLYNLVGHYGTLDATGHLDFYPNWGYLQPAWYDFLGPSLNPFIFNPFGMKSHERAHDLFVWSIKNPKQFVTNVQIKGNVSLASVSQNPFTVLASFYPEMGFYASPVVEGSFLISTNAQAPYKSKQITKMPACNGSAEVYIDAISCEQNDNPRVKITEQLNGLHKLEVFAHKSNRWNLLYTVYHSKGTMSTVVTKHELYGDVDDVEVTETNTFKAEFCSCTEPIGGMFCSGKSEVICDQFTGIKPKIDDAYKGETLRTSFEQQTGQKFPFNDDNIAHRGHMVPNGDFEKKYPQFRKATYLYLNAVPMWESVNIGNWKKIETYIRRNSQQVKNLKIYSLAFGNFQYNGVAIQLSKIDAEDLNWDKIKIPSQLVKVVIGSNGGLCRNVFVVQNDPRDVEENGACHQCPGLNLSGPRANGEGRGRTDCPTRADDVVTAAILNTEENGRQRTILQDVLQSEDVGSCFN